MESETLNREKLQESEESHDSDSIIDFCDFDSADDVNFDSTVTQTRCNDRMSEIVDTQRLTTKIMNLNGKFNDKQQIGAEILSYSKEKDEKTNRKINSDEIYIYRPSQDIYENSILEKIKIKSKIKINYGIIPSVDTKSILANINFNRILNNEIKGSIKKTPFTEISEKFFFKYRGKSCYDDLVSQPYLNKISNYLNENLMTENRKICEGFLKRTKNDIEIRKYKSLSSILFDTSKHDRRINFKSLRSNEKFLQDQIQHEKEKQLNILKLRESFQKERISLMRETPLISQRSVKLASHKKKSYSISNVHLRLNSELIGLKKFIENKKYCNENFLDKLKNNKCSEKKFNKNNYKSIVNKLYSINKKIDNNLNPKSKTETSKLNLFSKTEYVKISQSRKLLIMEKFTKSFLKKFKNLSEINNEEYINILINLNFVRNNYDKYTKDLINRSWRIISQLYNNDISVFSILVFLFIVMGLYAGENNELLKIFSLYQSLNKNSNIFIIPPCITQETAKKIKNQFRIFYDNYLNFFDYKNNSNKLEKESIYYNVNSNRKFSKIKSNSIINSLSDNPKTQNRKIRQKEIYLKNKNEKEMKECTFKPKINKIKFTKTESCTFFHKKYAKCDYNNSEECTFIPKQTLLKKEIFSESRSLNRDSLYKKRVHDLAQTRIENMMNYMIREQGYNSRKNYIKQRSLSNFEAFQKEYDFLKSNPRFIFQNELKKKIGNFNDYNNF